MKFYIEMIKLTVKISAIIAVIFMVALALIFIVLGEDKATELMERVQNKIEGSDQSTKNTEARLLLFFVKYYLTQFFNKHNRNSMFLADC